MSNRRRILFVDDDPNVTSGLRRLLRKQQAEWDMAFAGSGAEALTKMAQCASDVLVTDLAMPGMDGIELLTRVAEAYPGVARIVLSGNADENSTKRALKLAHQFLSKPTDVETLKSAVDRACAARASVQDEILRTAIAGCDVLPSLPTLYVDLTRAAESETADTRQIAEIITKDMGMCAKLLQLVNSSFFGVGRRISSIEHAISLLGLIRVRGLVLGEHVFRQFQIPEVLSEYGLERLWDHAFRVARMAEIVAKMVGQSGDRVHQAFTAGLLHDVGVILLASYRPLQFRDIMILAQDTPLDICEAERRVIGVSHTEIGTSLLSLWGLPPRIVEGVTFHHSPNEVNYNGVCSVTAVHAADALISRMEIQPDDPAHSRLMVLAPELDLDYLRRLHIETYVGKWEEAAMQLCSPAETLLV